MCKAYFPFNIYSIECMANAIDVTASPTSDPSLARQDGTIKSDQQNVDYSLPPPYTAQPEVSVVTGQEDS